MNTTQEPPKQPPLTDLVEQQEDDAKLALALAEAQEEIAAIKDARLEERIGWIVVVVIVIDCFVLLQANNAGGPIVIGVLELALLSVVAARLGVQEFQALFVKVFERMTSSLTERKD